MQGGNRGRELSLDPSEGGNCGDVCSPGNGFCESFGLSCGIYMINNGGTITSSCWKCM